MEREKLKSRLGFILLSAGCAIGIGNVWKFPYMAGQGGGGAFVLFYLLFLVILGLPIMSMEFAVGRASHKSPVRAYQAVHRTPVFVERASGSHIYDVDGNAYIDYVCSWGPCILGHAYLRVIKAVQAACENGLTYDRKGT